MAIPSYEKTTWQNGTTPINETNLNKIENQLESITDAKDTTTTTGTSLTLTDCVADTCKVKSNSKNLFNGNYKTGYRLDSSGAEISVADYSVSDYILVQPNTQYVANWSISTNNCVCYYTADGIGTRNIDTNPFTTPSDCVKIRFSRATANIDTAQIEEGSTATAYNPYNTEVILSNGTDSQSIILTPQEEKVAFTYDTETTLTSNGSVTIEYNTQSRLLNNDDLQVLDGHLVSINSGIGSRVNFIKNKNLFTPANTMSGLYKVGDGTYLIDSGAICTREMIEIDNTKNYVLSATSPDSSAKLFVMYYSASGSYLGYKESTFSVGNIVLNTFTSYSSARYIHIRFDNTNVQNVMLEEGENQTTYETYDRTINIDDEKIYSKNKDDIYTTAEQRIGTWKDGRPLYRKVIDYTIPSGTTSTEISLGVSNIRLVQRAEVRFNAVGSGDYVFNSYYNSASDYMRFFMRSNKLQIRLGANSSGFNIVAIVEYTKSTD